ncbi:MAG: Leucine-rich repeat (LRR) protein, partial [Salibacteraceae bacterium]
MREPELVYHIDLRNQRLTTFPEQLYKFPNLRSIILSDNNLQKIEIKPNTFQNVVMLDLANNKINEFSIGKNSLTFIKKLNLDNNQLILFPQLGNFNFIVEELYLRYNFIAHIPEGELFPSTLKFLYLDKNPIKNHIVIFREGKQLETLTLYHTGFKSFREKGSLNKLTKLHLSDNPLDWNSFNPIHFPKLAHVDLSYINLELEDPFIKLIK